MGVCERKRVRVESRLEWRMEVCEHKRGRIESRLEWGVCER